MYESTESMYNMIFCRYLITTLVLEIKLSEHVIAGGYGPYERCTASMGDLDAYRYKPLSIMEKSTPE